MPYPAFRRTVAPLLALIAAGVVGNHFGAAIFFDIDFLIGGVFAMLALQFIGYGPGVVAAVAISSMTYFSRHLPLDIILMTLEVIVVGRLYRRQGLGLVVVDALFWLCLGMPLAYFFCQGGLPLTSSRLLTSALEQAINGVTNALLARLIFMALSSRSRQLLFPLREVVFNLLALFVMIPALTMMVYEHRQKFTVVDQGVRKALRQSSQSMMDSLGLWLGQKSMRLSHLAWLSRHEFPELQHDLDFLRGQDADLIAVGIIDKDAVSIAFSPQIDQLGQNAIGKDFSDRPYLSELKRTLSSQLSEVVISKVGKPEPVAIMMAPVVDNGVYEGYVAALLDLARVQKTLVLQGTNSGLWCTILDQKNQVVATNREELAAMALFSRAPGALIRLDGEVSQWQPQAAANYSFMERWQNSAYVVERKIGIRGEWRLIVEQPLAPSWGSFSALYADQLELVFLVLLIALAVADIFSRRVLVSVVSLQEISSNLPAKLDAVGDIAWPTSFIGEVETVIGNFRQMALLLFQKFRELRQLNLTLEQRVDERTKALQDMTKNLADKVEQEVVRRQKNEQILLQQAKLATMGEMLGAIAHQWRQPLNSLGLCIQNIKESFRFGELSQEYLDSTVQESMTQLNHMSRTIDDFRNFFRPDKEKARFDLMLAVGQVLSLFSSQFIAHDISFVLTCRTHQRTFDKVQDIVACSAKITLGYKNEFEHVVLNLVNNARDAIFARRAQGLMPETEPGLISFEFENVANTITIRVIDNGIGIPESIVDRIFEPYFTTKDSDKGTGIGLYLAKIMIEEHMHGKLFVENREQGACFVLVLPAVRSSSEEIAG